MMLFIKSLKNLSKLVKVLGILLIFITINQNLNALEDYKKMSFKEKIEGLGLQPTYIIKSDENTFEVFCLGQDLNFNGKIELDSGDVYSSWWRLKVVSPSQNDFLISKEKVMDITDDIIQYSFKPYFDEENKHVYLNCQRTVKLLDVSIENPKILAHNIFEIAEIPNNQVVLTKYENKLVTTKYEFYQSDSIRIYTLDLTGLNFVKSFQCGENTINAKYVNSMEFDMIFVLDQGTFGQPNSKVYTIISPLTDNSVINESTVGSGANSLFVEEIDENKKAMYLVISADNKVEAALLDAQKPSVFTLGEPQTYDGPREVYTQADWNYFFVSTFGKKLFVFDKSFTTGETPNLEPIDILDLNGKGENIEFARGANYLFVMTPLDENYQNMSSIDVFYEFPLGIEKSEVPNVDLIKLYPNPANSESKINITFEKEIEQYFNVNTLENVTLFNSNSQVIDNLNIGNIESIDLNKYNLSSGTYYVKFDFANGFMVKVIVVSK